MLEQLTERIRDCYQFAAEARARADAINDPALKAEFLEAEKQWLFLARSFGFSESLEDFTAENSERRRAFDLRLHMRSGPQHARSLSAEQVLWSIVENSDDAIITTNLDGIISGWNQSAERIFGYTAEEAIGESVTILIPPERQDEEPAILAAIGRGERMHHYETIRRHKDGSLIDISLTISPIKDAQGKIIGASKIARDITERKRSDERIATLASEAEHRTKNILATVQATVNLSHSDTTAGLKRAIEGRIRALSNVHSLLVKTRWDGADLSSVVAQELSPYLGSGEARAEIDGPLVLLAADTAQAIAMTLHELATNAAKHGCLSAPDGKVAVTWSLEADGRLILQWIESGGPSTAKPTRKGFGTSIVDRMIGDLNGKIHRDWREQGLACQITLQL